MLEGFYLVGLAGLLFLLTVGLLFSQSMLSILIVSGLLSLTSALLFYWMDAVDVALTELVVGAVSGVFILLAMRILHGGEYLQVQQVAKNHHGMWLILLIGLTLFWMTQMNIFETFGQIYSAAYQAISTQYYLFGSERDIVMPNVVTKVLGSYRGYDTFGEVVVVFSAGLSVFSILSGKLKVDSTILNTGEDILIKTLVGKLLPILLLFALYVQFHGDYGPGGGFQAGALAALVLCVFVVVFKQSWLNNDWVCLHWLGVLGVLLYGLTGLIGVLLGGQYLDYSVLGKTAIDGQHWGILLIELGIFLTVFSVLSLIFKALMLKVFSVRAV